ncbi:MAG: carbohydrate binding domain-containing protein [Spirochaetes bacterium]|nr:carbohydrate binding domain-containing protein [Spirochaetota bacterium]
MIRKLALFCLTASLLCSCSSGGSDSDNVSNGNDDPMDPTASIVFTTGTGTTYYVSNDGNDENNGESANSSWKTLDKVNSFGFKPGDVIKFKSGDVWRGQLLPKSGNSTALIQYTSYGDGDKPLILGSVSKNNESDWVNIGGNIWSTVNKTKSSAAELITNGSFDSGLGGWIIQIKKSGNAEGSYIRNTDEYYSAPACMSITADHTGLSSWDIYFSSSDISIEAGKNYQLSFMAKSIGSFRPYGVIDKRDASNAMKYFESTQFSSAITDTWTRFTYNFKATTTASDASFDIYMGDSIPNGATVYFDDISFKELESDPLVFDIGNIMFDKTSSKEKCFYEYELDKQNDFIYDAEKQAVRVVSSENPAKLYKNIELSQRRNIIDQENVSYVQYSNLKLMYGGVHGIGGGETKNIIIKDCDVSFIGGAFQTHCGRYGNGIEFWNNSSDCFVEGCSVGECFDTGISNQSRTDGVVQRNIIYRNNRIYNCEASYEVWGQGENCIMENIYFENNLLENSGGGWSGNEENHYPWLWGCHILMFRSAAKVKNMYFTGNTFKNARSLIIDTWGGEQLWNDLEKIVVDYNTYIQPENKDLILWTNDPKGTGYLSTASDFARYQKETGNDKHSTLRFE